MRNTETYNTLQKPEILFPTMKPLDKPESAKRAGWNQLRCPRRRAGPGGLLKVELSPCSRSSWTSRPLPSPTSGP